MIIFVNGSTVSLARIMQFLSKYEEESGHAINKSKSCFIVSEKMAANRVQSIATATGFVQKKLPIKYLGCLLFKW